MLAGIAVAAAPDTALAHQQGFDDKYISLQTRGVDQMDAHPALKVPLFPVAIVLDAALLPSRGHAGYIREATSTDEPPASLAASRRTSRLTDGFDRFVWSGDEHSIDVAARVR